MIIKVGFGDGNDVLGGEDRAGAPQKLTCKTVL